MTAMNGASRVPPDTRFLPASFGSLAGEIPPAPVGTLFVLGAAGGFVSSPHPGFAVMFGRNETDVHVCVGAGDPQVSRLHGRLTYHGHEWWIRNEGRVPIRLPRSTLLVAGQEVPLAEGYIPLFIRTAPQREHLIEVRIVGRSRTGASARPSDETVPRQSWEINDTERLVLTALAQRYLRQDAHPQPLSWRQVDAELNTLAGREEWRHNRAANVVAAVRRRLTKAGVPGLTLDDVGDPVGNALNHNLIQELLESTTLMPPDLRLLSTTED